MKSTVRWYPIGTGYIQIARSLAVSLHWNDTCEYQNIWPQQKYPSVQANNNYTHAPVNLQRLKFICLFLIYHQYPQQTSPCAVPYGWVAPAYAKMPILLILSLFPRITTYMRFMNTPILIKFLILGLKIIQDIRIRHFLNN